MKQLTRKRKPGDVLATRLELSKCCNATIRTDESGGEKAPVKFYCNKCNKSL